MISATRRAAWRCGAPVRLLLIGCISVYRVTLAGVLGGQCRFHPSCSAYAIDAIRSRGAVRGTILATWRVLRCNPFGKGGLDPASAERPAPLYDAVTHGATP